MKLVFSEHRSEYANYVFPYAIWAFPEPGETPADVFAHGFLPSSRQLDRFYLCRNVRIRLSAYRASSENRRVLRKGSGIRCRLIPRSEFEYTPGRREFMKRYADAKFGVEVMSYDRLDSLFQSPITSHVMVFADEAEGREVGLVTLLCQPERMAYYYYAFYDLSHPVRSLGLFLMTSAVELFAKTGYGHLYLGTCYSQNALYKTQFAGAEFFSGFGWSGDLDELKYLIQRDGHEGRSHLLETEAYRTRFHASLEAVAEASPFFTR